MRVVPGCQDPPVHGSAATHALGPIPRALCTQASEEEKVCSVARGSRARPRGGTHPFHLPPAADTQPEGAGKRVWLCGPEVGDSTAAQVQVPDLPRTTRVVRHKLRPGARSPGPWEGGHRACVPSRPSTEVLRRADVPRQLGALTLPAIPPSRWSLGAAEGPAADAGAAVCGGVTASRQNRDTRETKRKRMPREAKKRSPRSNRLKTQNRRSVIAVAWFSLN